MNATGLSDLRPQTPQNPNEEAAFLEDAVKELLKTLQSKIASEDLDRRIRSHLNYVWETAQFSMQGKMVKERKEKEAQIGTQAEARQHWYKQYRRTVEENKEKENKIDEQLVMMRALCTEHTKLTRLNAFYNKILDGYRCVSSRMVFNSWVQSTRNRTNECLRQESGTTSRSVLDKENAVIVCAPQPVQRSPMGRIQSPVGRLYGGAALATTASVSLTPRSPVLASARVRGGAGALFAGGAPRPLLASQGRR